MTRVLIVEDDELILDAYKSEFTHYAGMDFDLAEDGVEAHEAIERNRPDIIILDIIMPNSDGYGFLESLKKDDRTKDIPVIVATNLDSEKDRARLRALGVKHYMVKARVSVKNIIDACSQLAEGKAARKTEQTGTA